jgi:hypothetical protein
MNKSIEHFAVVGRTTNNNEKELEAPDNSD